MWEDLGPWLLVGLLVGLAVASLPWLLSLIPDEATSFLLQTIQNLEQIEDLQARVMVVIGGAGEAHGVKLDLVWLREAGAARASLRWPPQLAGEEFAYHSGRLIHYIPSPDPQQTGGVIVRVTLEQGSLPPPEDMMGSLLPEPLLEAIRRRELRARVYQELFGEGWERLEEWAYGFGHRLDESGLSLDLIPKTLRPWPVGFPVWIPPIPPLPGPRRLEVSGQVEGLPSFRRVELWFPPSALLPSNIRVYLENDEEKVAWISIREVEVNRGLALREVLTLPPARAVIWE